MDRIARDVLEALRPLAERAEDALKERIRPLAAETAALLDECGSEDEFRLRCAARNEDPEEAFRPYAQYVWLVRGLAGLGVPAKLRLSDWWAFEKTPGAGKPDPWLTGYAGRLR